MSEKQVRKMKTRCYYTDYTNHMIRFYLSTPEILLTSGKRKADLDNWIAVQSVFHFLPDDQKQVLAEVYKAHHKLPEGVRIYCEKTGADENRVWVLITKVNAAVAKRRGLV
jgi:hypothetical protein